MKRIKTDFRNKLSGEAPGPFDDISDWEKYQNCKVKMEGITIRTPLMTSVQN